MATLDPRNDPGRHQGKKSLAQRPAQQVDGDSPALRIVRECAEKGMGATVPLTEHFLGEGEES